MKKLMMFFLAAFCCLVVVSCGSKQEAVPETTSQNKIGILVGAATHGWTAAVASLAESRCKQYGELIDYKICPYFTNDDLSSQLDMLKEWGAKAIVVCPQSGGIEGIISQAVDAGLKVVSFGMALDCEGVCNVSGDNAGVGKASALYIVDKIGKNGTVAIMDAPSTGSVAALRIKSFVETIAALAPETKLLRRATQFTREDGLKDFSDMLSEVPHLDAVFSLDDECSIGILQAVTDANRKDIKVITGCGGCQEYFKLMEATPDIWLQSTLYSPSMVMKAVDCAYDLLCEKEVQPSIIISTSTVDRTNCARHISEKAIY